MLSDGRPHLDKGCLTGAYCVFGVFDGAHLGHRFIIEKTKEKACKAGKRSYIITFDTDPDALFKRSGFKKIMTDEDRLRALSAMGTDGVVVLDFSKVRDLSGEDFLDRIIAPNIPDQMDVGYDLRFGRGARSSLDDLVAWGQDHRMRVEGCELLTMDGSPITSTRIRGLLAKGCIQDANALLGHPYSISGDVLHGRGEGASFGIKTANMSIPEDAFILKEGVYAAIAHIEGEAYRAAVSVGVSPTFKEESSANIEVHVLDFDGDIYGKRIEVSFFDRMRDMIRFDDVDELIETIKEDIEHVRTYPFPICSQ